MYTSGTVLRLALGFRIIVACPLLTMLTFLINRSSPLDLKELTSESVSSSYSVSVSTSIVPGPKTPLETVDTVRLRGSSSSIGGNDRVESDPRERTCNGSVLKNGMGGSTIESEDMDDTVVVEG